MNLPHIVVFTSRSSKLSVGFGRDLSYDRKVVSHVSYNCWRRMEIMWSFPVSSFRIPWIFWISGCSRLPCNFFLMIVPCFRFKIHIIPDLHLLRLVSLLYPSSRAFWLDVASGFESLLPLSSSFPEVVSSDCNRIFSGWGTCRNSWRQVHPHRLWFCHNSFFTLLFLHPLRHLFGAANQAGILGATSRVEMADVKQMKKIVPFVTCEIAFGQNVCEFMFGINVTDLNFTIKNNPVKQPIQSNSVGSWHVSHCGIPAFEYHLDHDFIVLRDV